MNRSWLWVLAGVLVVVVASYVFYAFTRPELLPEGFLYGSGHIEGTEIRIASEVSGRVIEQQMAEGQAVAAGATLLTIDPAVSRDQLRAVEAELDALRETRAALAAQITTWAHHVETAEAQVARLERLTQSDLASQQSLDSARDAARQGAGELRRLQAQSEALDQQIAGAESRVSLARTQLDRTTIYAPQSGTVLVRAVEAGEVVQAGQPLALLVDLSRLELKVYLSVDQIGKVRLGDEARVRVDAFPDQLFEARVARVDDYAQFTPRDIHVPEERTQMVYGATLALDNAELRLKPGMPADAWVRWDDVPWPEQLPIPRD
jgi:HlyD family secretion protein